MKKFFALMLVVAMLSVAGSAMAVTVTVSGDNTTVALYAGDTVTATVIVSADHPNTGVISSVDLTAAVNWITSSDLVASGDGYYTMKVTFAPGAAVTDGEYTATVSAYETYTSGDLVGHTPDYTVSDDVEFTVIILAEEQKAVVVENVSVISESVAVLPTFSDLQNTGTTVTQISNPETKSAIATALTNILSSLGVTVDVNAAVGGGSNIQAVEGAQKGLAVAAAKLKLVAGDNALVRAAGDIPPFKALANAFQAIGLTTFASVFYNQQIEMDLGETGAEVPGSFFAAAVTGTNQVVFLNSLGQQVTVVPDGTHGETAGKVTAVAYVEGGKTYEPLLFVRFPSAASMASFDSDAGTTVVSKVTVVVASDEPTPPTPVDPWGGKTYRIDVPQASIDRIASIDGRTLRTLVAATVSAEPVSDTTLYNVGGVSKDVVASLPTLANIAPNAANEAYIMAFKYSRPTITGRTISGDPEFYPQGPTGDQKGRVYNNTGLATLADIVTGNIGYIVFAVASNDTFSSFYAANANFSSPRVLATSVPVVPTPTPTYPEGTSSSSGGCSAGSAALALAVLGSFILTRKK